MNDPEYLNLKFIKTVNERLIREAESIGRVV